MRWDWVSEAKRYQHHHLYSRYLFGRLSISLSTSFSLFVVFVTFSFAIFLYFLCYFCSFSVTICGSLLHFARARTLSSPSLPRLFSLSSPALYLIWNFFNSGCFILEWIVGLLLRSLWNYLRFFSPFILTSGFRHLFSFLRHKYPFEKKCELESFLTKVFVFFL